MNKVAVVILNYLNYKDTIECVESLKQEKYINKNIVIVDNCSENNSWDILKERYQEEDNMHLIRTEENLGFARGNNIGIDYSRNILKCNFVLLMNNDTIVKDKNMIMKIMESYEEGVGIIGPRIISADEKEQNPVREEFNREIVETLVNYNGGFWEKISEFKIYKVLKSSEFLVKTKRKILGQISLDEEKRISDTECSENLILHGACMMLTSDYFRYFPKLFPNTFLYYEENILTLLTKKVGLSKKFINNTYIYHKEDQSSKMSFNNKREIKTKYFKESVKLCYQLFDMTYDEIKEKYFT